MEVFENLATGIVQPQITSSQINNVIDWLEKEREIVEVKSLSRDEMWEHIRKISTFQHSLGWLRGVLLVFGIRGFQQRLGPNSTTKEENAATLEMGRKLANCLKIKK